MSLNPPLDNLDNEVYFDMSDWSKKSKTGFTKEINNQLYIFDEWQKDQQTTCEVKQQPIKTQELKKQVDKIIENEIEMSNGISAYKLNECLKDQKEIKQQFFLQIFDTHRYLFNQRYFQFDITNMNERDFDNLYFTFELKFDKYFNEMDGFIQSKLDQDFLSLNQKTKEYKLKALFQTCSKVNNQMMSVYQKKQLNQPLSQKEQQQFNFFKDFLMKNQDSLQLLNQKLSEQDICDILEKLKDKFNEAIGKLSSPPIMQKSKKISK